MPFPNRYELAREECYYISKGLQPNGKPWPKPIPTPVDIVFLNQMRRDREKEEHRLFPLLSREQPKNLDYLRNF